MTSAASYALAGGSIVRWAEREQVPAVYPNPAYVMRGGLMSYSAQYPPLVDRAAVQIDKILRGADPAEIPVEQPTTFNCTLNTRTVSALGLTIPPALAETVTQWIA
ncbi:MAG: hypothetical protein JOY61_03250 [Chloroflexi bacterium]|nr:hypothetical protein [Chloroflexota bacterium]